MLLRHCSLFAVVLFLCQGATGQEPAKKPNESFDPRSHHLRLVAQAKPEFTFRDGTRFKQWQLKLRDALVRVLALPKSKPCPLDAKVTPDRSTDEFDSFRVVFTAEPGVRVPCYLLLPKERSGPLPVMICLQGHKKKDGMLVSIGRVPDGGGRDIAVQAVRNGWAALAVEQRCFGERRGDCQRQSLDALMLGRTLTGERVFDVTRAIDFIETRADLDKNRIGCMGNSTGGTVTFYAACVEPRIRLAVVSCSYCTYAESWMTQHNLPVSPSHLENTMGQVSVVVFVDQRHDPFPRFRNSGDQVHHHGFVGFELNSSSHRGRWDREPSLQCWTVYSALPWPASDSALWEP